MKILVKIPSRERPEQLKEILKSYLVREHTINDINYIISIDDDDHKTQNLKPYELHHRVKYITGERATKIEAINRDIPADGWDILLIGSDDMPCISLNWDRLIKSEMVTHFPDLDGVLWFSDGTQNRVCTFCIIGRKYYERFGYVYNPEYKSLFCDNEFTEVAIKMNKIKTYDKVLFEHFHPAHNPKGKDDDLYRHNHKFWDEDKATFYRRMALNFPI